MLAHFKGHILFYFFAILFLVLCFFCGEAYPRVWPDEVLFFSPSYHLYKYNILRTEVLKGLVPGMGTHTLWMPPLFFYFQALLFQFLPETLEVVRMGTAFLGVISIFFFSEIAREMGVKKKYRILLKLLLLSDFLFFKISHSARMESLCTLFAILSLYFLTYKMSEGRSVSRLRALLSGLSLGFAVLAHPFAISYFPIVFFLMYQRKAFTQKDFIYIGLGFLIVFSFWLPYVLPNFEIFKLQFGAQLGRKKELFGFFTFVKKFKIIFSEFRFPMFKVIIFFITLFSFLYLLLFRKREIEEPDFSATNNNKSKTFKEYWSYQTEKLKKFLEENILLSFAFAYLFTILIFLILSSESWYVYHFIFPFNLLLVALPSKKQEYLTELPWFLSICYNAFVYLSFIYLNLFTINMKKLTDVYYKQIESVIVGSKSVYLQAIPDPYFYFQKNKPSLETFEFIPGELPIPEDYYKAKIITFDAYLFYEPALMNPVLKSFFEKNSNLFHIEEIKIETPKKADLELKTYVYVKKTIYEDSKRKWQKNLK
ncbi:MAG: glycosyltransferase family 39 protein [Leptospiraceae bacterium]|nr:glycosyltransferase family 39 protein [Leptospiraceae bacterium]